MKSYVYLILLARETSIGRRHYFPPTASVRIRRDDKLCLLENQKRLTLHLVKAGVLSLWIHWQKHPSFSPL